MKCIKCGYDNLEGMKYCVSCGAELITRDEKNRRISDGNRGLESLKKIIGILIGVAVVVAIAYFGASFLFNRPMVEEDSDNLTPTLSTKVAPETIGVWKCDPEGFTDDNTIVFKLQSDGVFEIGPIGTLDTTRWEGTWDSISLGTKDSTGQYDFYQVNLNETLVVENDVEQEIDNKVTYSLAIDSQLGTRGIFVNGANNNSYYCSR